MTRRDAAVAALWTCKRELTRQRKRVLCVCVCGKHWSQLKGPCSSSIGCALILKNTCSDGDGREGVSALTHDKVSRKTIIAKIPVA